MPDKSLEITAPSVSKTQGETGGRLVLQGFWNLRGLAMVPDLRSKTKNYAAGTIAWDLSGIAAMDNAGALILWQAWGQHFPEHTLLRPEHQQLFLSMQRRPLPAPPATPKPAPLLIVAASSLKSYTMQIRTWVALLGQLILDLFHLLRHPLEIPWKEISATIHETGGRALGITALVGFLIGIVVSYLSSLQLRTFGAAIYIVNILGLSIIRELGPLLAAILVAGRSGSAMTASLGVMRVTQELDALAALGISHSQRLILPKVVALCIVMPLLVVWTDMIALIGGALAAHMELEISMHQFLLKLPSAVPVSNFFMGLR